MDPALAQLASVLEQLHTRITRLETRSGNPDFDPLSHMEHSSHNPVNHGVIKVHLAKRGEKFSKDRSNDTSNDFDLEWRRVTPDTPMHYSTPSVYRGFMRQLDEALKQKHLKLSEFSPTFRVGTEEKDLSSISDWNSLSKIREITVYLAKK